MSFLDRILDRIYDIFQTLFGLKRPPTYIPPYTSPNLQTNNSVSKQTTSKTVICTDGSTVKKDTIYSRYDLNSMKRIQNNFYLFGEANAPIAIGEILYVNTFLDEAAHLLSYFPKKQISKSNLCFCERIIHGGNAFCFASFKPLTNTGKMPKYPMELHFYNSEELFGDLYYGQDGEINKGDIIVWGSDICYEVKLRMIGGDLKLHTIYQTNPITYKKVKVYYQ